MLAVDLLCVKYVARLRLVLSHGQRKGESMREQPGKSYLFLSLLNCNEVRINSEIHFQGFTVYSAVKGELRAIILIRIPQDMETPLTRLMFKIFGFVTYRRNTHVIPFTLFTILLLLIFYFILM